MKRENEMRGKAGRWVAGGIAGLVALAAACGGAPRGTPAAIQPPGTPSATGAPTAVATVMPTSCRAFSQAACPTPQSSATPTLLPTATAVPSPTRPRPDEVEVRETFVSIPSYVYEPHLREAFDASRGVPYLWLDRTTYGEPSADSTVLTPFRAVVLENRYLRLTVLPELGGRLYECVFKPTGGNIFYRNQVLKPTFWGPLERERNWWLAAGGMEWAFPVNEHGYEWGSAWSYSIENSVGETSVALRDTTALRPRAMVEISLAPGRSCFAISPRVENPTSSPITYQYWTNAMLTLGSPSMSLNTEFVCPGREVMIHSAGPESGLPGERERISWPTYGGRNMAWYRNWIDWLGFFISEPAHDFVGAYNHDTALGVARIFRRQEVPGIKLFAWGPQSPYAAEYTIDGSQYFEMWGGPNRTFWPEDDRSLGAGESITWTEYWCPFSGTGGLDYANLEAALSVEARQDALHLGLATTSYQEGTVLLAVAGEEVYRRAVEIDPENPLTDQLPLPGGAPTVATVSLRFERPDGQPIVSYEEEMSLR